MNTKALDGWYPRRAIYGYKNDQLSKTLVRDDLRFIPIQECLIRFAQGSSIPELVKYLDLQGVKTKGTKSHFPRKLNGKDLWKILSNSKFYAGIYDWGESCDILGKHEKMITWEQHILIQKRLNNKVMTNIAEVFPPEDQFYLNFTISEDKGFLNCGCCGSRMRSCYSKGKMGKKYPYYYCANKECQCKQKSINKHKLERLFEDLLNGLRPTPNHINVFKLEIMALWDKEYQRHASNHEAAQIRKDTIKREMARTIKMRKDDELTKEEYKEEMNKLRTNLIVAESELGEILIDRNKVAVLLEQAEQFLTNIEPLYLGFSISNKQRFASLVFPKGITYQNGEVRTLEKSYLFEYLEAIKQEKSEEFLYVTPRYENTNRLFDEIKSILQWFQGIGLNLNESTISLSFS